MSLRSLRRVYSYWDTYMPGTRASCLLSALFQAARPEYVAVYNQEPDSAVTGLVDLARNTEDLRFLDVFQDKAVFPVTLLATPRTRPVAFYVVTQSSGKQIFGTLKGDTEDVANVELGLLHQPKRNQ